MEEYQDNGDCVGHLLVASDATGTESGALTVVHRALLPKDADLDPSVSYAQLTPEILMIYSMNDRGVRLQVAKHGRISDTVVLDTGIIDQGGYNEDIPSDPCPCSGRFFASAQLESLNYLIMDFD